MPDHDSNDVSNDSFNGIVVLTCTHFYAMKRWQIFWNVWLEQETSLLRDFEDNKNTKCLRIPRDALISFTACKNLKINSPYVQNNHLKGFASPINETVGQLPVMIWTHRQTCLDSVSITSLSCENWGLSNKWLENDYTITKLLMWCRAVW
jgi:hypothetical protein